MKALPQKNKSRDYTIATIYASYALIFGYYLGIMNAMSAPLFQIAYGFDLQKDASKVNIIEGASNAFFSLGCLVGSLLAPFLMNRVGRRRMVIATDIYICLSIFLFLVLDYVVLIISRFLVGAYVGLALNLTPISFEERFTGNVSAYGNAATGIFIQIGLLVGYLTQNVMSFEAMGKNFRAIFIAPIGIIVARVLLIIFFTRTETPTFIYLKYRKDPERLKAALQESVNETYVDNTNGKMLAEMIRFFDEENSTRKAKEGSHPGFRSLFSRSVLPRTISGFLTAAGNQMCGNTYLAVYSNKIFAATRASVQTMTLITGIAPLIGAFIAIPSTKYFGRKTGLVIGLLVECFGLLVIRGAVLINSVVIISFGLISYMLAYSIGPSTVLFTYIAEILPPVGFGSSLALNYILSAILGQVNSILIPVLGMELMLIYALLCFIWAILLDYFNIETKDKSYDQRVDEFQRMNYTPLGFLSENQAKMEKEFKRSKSRRATKAQGIERNDTDGPVLDFCSPDLPQPKVLSAISKGSADKKDSDKSGEPKSGNQ